MTAQDSAHRNFIGGEWVTGPTSITNINPSDTNDVVGLYAHADAAQARAAVVAAHEAFQSWQYSPRRGPV
jgi:aldehyde dehydrogenase (NAD+)